MEIISLRIGFFVLILCFDPQVYKVNNEKYDDQFGSASNGLKLGSPLYQEVQNRRGAECNCMYGDVWRLPYIGEDHILEKTGMWILKKQ